MTDTDPFRYDDAAYVLGALSPEESAAFEEHLLTCDACVARVREVNGVPALLAGVDEAELIAAGIAGPGQGDADRPPDTLLPGLLRAAARERRRQRRTVGALTTLAAACVAALVVGLIVALWPSPGPATVAQRQFVAVAPSPVRASAALQPQAWGTAIDLHCHYVDRRLDLSYDYVLVAYDRSGGEHRLGDWRLPPARDIEYKAGTSLSPGDIAKLEITLPDGTPLLRLTT